MFEKRDGKIMCVSVTARLLAVYSSYYQQCSKSRTTSAIELIERDEE